MNDENKLNVPLWAFLGMTTIVFGIYGILHTRQTKLEDKIDDVSDRLSVVETHVVWLRKHFDPTISYGP